MTPHRPAWAHTIPVAIALMAPFDLLASLAMDVYLPVVPTMPRALDTSEDMIQLSLSLYLLGLGLGQVIFGPLSDLVGRRPVLLAGAALFALASGLLALASTGPVFVVTRLVQALGASAALVATFATVRDVYGERPEGPALYAALGSILAFVPAAGPILGSLVAALSGWRAIFWLLAALAAPALLHAVFRWPETRPIAARRLPSPAPILRSSSFWVFTLAFSAAMGAFFVFFSIAPRLLITRAGLSELAFSLAFATTAVAMILTARAAPRLTAKLGVPGSVRLGMGLLIAASVCFAAVSPLGVSIGTVILPSWLMAIGIVLTVSVSATGALAAFGDRAGLAVALYFAVQSVFVSLVGTAAVALLGGHTIWPLVAYGLTLPIGVSAVLWRHGRGR